MGSLMSPQQKAWQAKQEAEKHDALVRLGVARRERLTKEDYDVYLDALQAFEAGTVRAACLDLAGEPPNEYEPRFPPLYVVKARCGVIARRKMEQEDERRRLAAAPPAPVSKERMAELMRRIKAAAHGKVMR